MWQLLQFWRRKNINRNKDRGSISLIKSWISILHIHTVFRCEYLNTSGKATDTFHLPCGQVVNYFAVNDFPLFYVYASWMLEGNFSVTWCQVSYNWFWDRDRRGVIGVARRLVVNIAWGFCGPMSTEISPISVCGASSHKSSKNPYHCYLQ